MMCVDPASGRAESLYECGHNEHEYETNILRRCQKSRHLWR